MSFCLVVSDAGALSIEEEKALGDKFLDQVRKHFEILNDDFTTAFISHLGQYLASTLDTRPFPFHFYIIKDNTLNAFAAPGGHIFLFSGLVEVTESVDELGAIICHEMGHVAARHLSHRLEQNKKIGLATMAGILAGALIGGPLAEALVTGSVAAGIQAQLHYSRNDERQADQLGFGYMTRAGLDPAAMIGILKKIERGGWLGTDRVPPYLLTHPTGPVRMADLDSMLSQLPSTPPDKKTKSFREEFPLFKVVVQARCLDTGEAEKLFRSALKQTPNSPLPHFGLGMVYLEESDYPGAIRNLKRALEAKPRFVPLLRKLGEAYQMNGESQKAVDILQKALTLNDQDGPTLFLLGLSYENLEQYEKAVHLFERLTSFEPVKPEVYYHLGLSYGRQNRLGIAHYNFGLYFKKLGKPAKAAFHFRKAKEFSQNNPSLLKKILKVMGKRP